MRKYAIIIAFALSAFAAGAQEWAFTNGIFFVNEDRYGPNQGSVNFFDYGNDEMVYNVYAQVNPNTNLGVTTQHGQIFGGRFFLVSKQANGSESAGSTYGCRLAVLDAVTLNQQGSLLRFGATADSIYDGRSYCGVNADKGYIATSAGIFVLDVNAMATSGPIEGTQSSASGNYNSLYKGQCGDMVRFGQYVFAVQQGRGLHVIDPTTDRVVATLPFPDIVTVFVTAGGGLYVANNSREVYDFGAGPYESDFTQIDPVTFETLAVHSLGDKGALCAWGAWHARMLCVDLTSERVYYNHEEYQNYISCYDFETGVLTDTLILLPEAAEINWDGTRNRQGLYSSALSIDPHTGDLVVQTVEAAPMYAYQIFNHNWVLFYDLASGTLKRQIRLQDAYWFPAMAVYPDVCGPEVTIGDMALAVGEERVVSLLESVKDADNLSALAVTTAFSSDETVTQAWVSGQELHVKAMGRGNAVVSVTADSNGKLANETFTVTVSGTSMRGDVNMDGKVNVSDVTTLIEVAMGSVLCNYDPVAADLNGNGVINVTDVTMLITLIMNMQ